MPATERPILFSAPMVCALLAGTKTQTRRVVKWRGLQQGLNLQFSGLSVERSGSNFVLSSPTRTSHEYRSIPQPCPYGQSGDRLWVRETWRVGEDVGEGWTPYSEAGDLHVIYDADGARDYRRFPDGYAWPRCHKTAHNSVDTPEHWISRGPFPSIHMPRWASRITLEITDVRVQRLQEISDADAIAEGIAELVPQPNRGEGLTPAALCLAAAATVEAMPRTTRRGFLAGALAATLGFAASPSRPWEVVPARWTRPPTARQVYAVLWESINGPGSWAANPWVWAISFTRAR